MRAYIQNNEASTNITINHVVYNFTPLADMFVPKLVLQPLIAFQFNDILIVSRGLNCNKY
jgi:hypothetical protein